jgi:hypothetical protein
VAAGDGALFYLKIPSSSSSLGNDLPYKEVTLDGLKLKLKKEIARGGFGVVFLVNSSQGRFALKRLQARRAPSIISENCTQLFFWGGFGVF